ncbi:hypothetical protein BDM02DRAFT_3129738 [Thelephora ganbajun]|uniref:Uncharacterized protein n=1 Tax=Thelephora ganbajun TaxID=370292 RepID=A0ACB6ZDH3_THEGA|nr:hypothetical protein BDM02DRAFT_3129738 [Thelephora ganbajun]
MPMEQLPDSVRKATTREWRLLVHLQMVILDGYRCEEYNDVIVSSVGEKVTDERPISVLSSSHPRSGLCPSHTSVNARCPWRPPETAKRSYQIDSRRRTAAWIFCKSSFFNSSSVVALRSPFIHGRLFWTSNGCHLLWWMDPAIASVSPHSALYRIDRFYRLLFLSFSLRPSLSSHNDTAGTARNFDRGLDLSASDHKSDILECPITQLGTVPERPKVRVSTELSCLGISVDMMSRVDVGRSGSDLKLPGIDLKPDSDGPYDESATSSIQDEVVIYVNEDQKLGVTGPVFLILNKVVDTSDILTFAGLDVYLEFDLVIPRSSGEKNHLGRMYHHLRLLATSMLLLRVILLGFSSRNTLAFGRYILYANDPISLSNLGIFL